MALATERDLEELRAGLVRWLGARRATDVVVTGIERPSVGHSSETLLVDYEWRADGETDTDHVVVRLPPASGGTFPDFDLTAQAAAQAAAGTAGVAVAEPTTVEPDASWLGAPFMTMPRVEGHIIGPSSPHDPWLAALGARDQARLHDGFIATLGAIHRADADRARRDGVAVRDLAAELDYWDDYLTWSSPGAPVETLVLATDWCRDHRPATDPPPCLLWGDARLGNVIFADDLTPAAVLDWDMASIGAPEHDLAWFLTLEATVEHVAGARVAGFPGRAETIESYERDLGRPVRDFEWFETFAQLRATAIMTRIGYLHAAVGGTGLVPIADNPVLDLLRERLR